MKNRNSTKKVAYADVGVDTSAIRKSQDKIARRLTATFHTRKNRIGEVLTPIGHYAGLVKVSDSLAMASHSDGLGTKVLVAQRAQQYDTVGIDCVAMNVNDLICLGAEPTTLIDYIALEEHRIDLLEPLIDGLARGAEEAQVAVTGGETAIMGKVIQGDRPGYGFDLAACVCGFVDPAAIIDGHEIQPQDRVYGIPSSGFHSNGYTLLRHIIFEQEGLTVASQFPGTNQTVAEVLLEPTRIYVSFIAKLLDEHIPIHGLAHITGGAFTKLSRLTGAKLGFHLDSFPEPASIFRTIQDLAHLSEEELFSTFNCGIGMVIVIPPESETQLKKLRTQLPFPLVEIGHVTSSPKIQIGINGKLTSIPFKSA